MSSKSKKSSSRSSSSINTELGNNGRKRFSSLSFVGSLIVNGLIIYYLYNITEKQCGCIEDWRTKFIYFMAILNIILSLLTFMSGTNYATQYMPLAFLLMIFSIINLYAFFTYIGDLQTTKCSCAIDKQPTLNSFMNFLRWFQIIVVVVGLVFMLLFGATLYKAFNPK